MKKQPKTVEVEEDGDEVLLSFEDAIKMGCVIAGCNYARIEKNDKGFLCCTRCGSSYGKRVSK